MIMKDLRDFEAWVVVFLWNTSATYASSILSKLCVERSHHLVVILLERLQVLYIITAKGVISYTARIPSYPARAPSADNVRFPPG